MAILAYVTLTATQLAIGALSARLESEAAMTQALIDYLTDPRYDQDQLLVGMTNVARLLLAEFTHASGVPAREVLQRLALAATDLP